MKGIKWFQRTMIVLLVGVNVLFYCIKSGMDFSFSLSYTCSSMVLTSLVILILVQSKKRKATKITAVKKSKM